MSSTGRPHLVNKYARAHLHIKTCISVGTIEGSRFCCCAGSFFGIFKLAFLGEVGGRPQSFPDPKTIYLVGTYLPK